MYYEHNNTVQATFMYLRTFMPHSNWFIAGGCLNSDSFSDIDVFFHSKKDYEAAAKCIPRDRGVHSTTNSESFNFDVSPFSCLGTIDYSFVKIQLIRKYFGLPGDLITKFDLNKSQIALTSYGTKVESPSFNKPLHLIYGNMSSNSLKRFIKYIKIKGFEATPYKELQNYTNYILANPTLELPAAYTEGKPILAKVALKQIIDVLTPTIGVTKSASGILSAEDAAAMQTSLKQTFPELYI